MKSRAPKILSRKVVFDTPWVRFVEKEVQFPWSESADKYYSVAGRDFVVILGITPDKKIPIVHQYRPAIEAFTEELPSGILEEGETPEGCSKREMFEETGLGVQKLYSIGNYYPEVGRLEQRQHAFVAQTMQPTMPFHPEPGVESELVTVDEFLKRVENGRFKNQQHICVFFLGRLRYPNLFS